MKRYIVHVLFIALFNLIGLGLVYNYSNFNAYTAFNWFLFSLWAIVLTSVAILVSEAIQDTGY